MSNSPNKTMDTQGATEKVQLDNQAAQSNSSEKRVLPEAADGQIKKMKIETPILEQKVSGPSAASTAPPKFVSASTMIEPIQEISDEELLEFVLEYERQHGIE